MRAYRNEVWDMLGNFFNEHRVIVIPIIQNKITYSLAIAAGNFKIHVYSNRKYKIEVVNRPSIPDNSKYWQVFEDDLQIKIFLEILDEFSNTIIYGENQSLENVEDDKGFAVGDEEQKNMKGMIGGKDIIHLRSNFIPKGLIPLEKLFDINHVTKTHKVQPHEDEIQDKNIGTEDQPKIIKLSKALPT